MIWKTFWRAALIVISVAVSNGSTSAQTLISGAVRPDSTAARAEHPAEAVEHDHQYYTRLRLHRDASYVAVPLFGAEYILGRSLLNGTSAGWVRPTHIVIFHALGVIFVFNTITGIWNAIESRHDKEGRVTRNIHVALMLASDAGFAHTAAIAKDAKRLGMDAKIRHRNAALFATGLATVGITVMWTR